MKTKAVLFSLAILIFVAIINIPLNLWAGVFSEQALEYRARGYQAQRDGDIDRAIKYYQKAIVLKPNYATVYNDLGIVYEAKGWLDRAEQAYLEALRIDPHYVDAYSNLALLYERRKDIDKAAFYWRKRIEFGDPGELWTQKAWQKLDEYFPVQKHHRRAESLFGEGKYEEALAEINKALKLTPDERELVKLDELKIAIRYTQAQKHHRRAESLFGEGKYEEALEEISKALKLAPDEREIVASREKIRIKVIEVKIAAHYAQGMKHYRKGDYRKAGEEFKKMLELLPGED